MPTLSFSQLAKVFAAGFVGYALVISLLSLATAVAFPDFVKGRMDMSLHEFFRMVFYYFGVLGLIATPLMLIGAWGLLRVFRK
jgi:hypothetical protein